MNTKFQFQVSNSLGYHALFSTIYHNMPLCSLIQFTTQHSPSTPVSLTAQTNTAPSKRIPPSLNPMNMATHDPNTLLTPTPPHLTLNTLRYAFRNRHTAMCTRVTTHTQTDFHLPPPSTIPASSALPKPTYPLHGFPRRIPRLTVFHDNVLDPRTHA